MKVLFVSKGNNKNKISKIVLAQSKSLIEKGIEIEYFIIQGKGIKSYFKSIKLLKEFLRNNSFDIIHAHYSLSGITAFFSKSNEKLVVSLMGSDILGGQLDKKVNTIDKLISLVSKIFSKYFFDFCICKSKNIQDKLFKNTKSIIIPNGVDFDIFKPLDKLTCRNELKINHENKIILFATDPKRIEKNYKLAENAFKILENNLNQIELICVFDVEQTDLVKYYNAADIILMTSYYEGSPNVIKEALACNKVIVSTDVGDVRENFNLVDNCFLTSFDSTDLSQKLEIALTKKESNGRIKIEHLRKDYIANQIIDIYKNLL